MSLRWPWASQPQVWVPVLGPPEYPPCHCQGSLFHNSIICPTRLCLWPWALFNPSFSILLHISMAQKGFVCVYLFFSQFFWEIIDTHHCGSSRYTARWFNLYMLWNNCHSTCINIHLLFFYLWQNMHNINHFNHFQVYNSVTLNTLVYNQHHHVSLEICHVFKLKFYTHWTLTLPPLSSPVLGNHSFTVSMNLIIAGSPCKWNHTIFVLLCLVSLHVA